MGSGYVSSNGRRLLAAQELVVPLHFMVKNVSFSEEKGFGLDNSIVTVEKFPLIVAPLADIKLRRIE